MIPELHDVGKLLGLKEHWFEDADKPPVSEGIDEETWLAIRYHGHERNMSKADQRMLNDARRLDKQASGPARRLWFVSLADGAAASVRVLASEDRAGLFPLGTQRLRLWRSLSAPKLIRPAEAERAHGRPTAGEKTQLLTHALSAKSWPQFCGSYEKLVNETPEDKNPLRAVTSLRSHCELVGKVYRLLDGSVASQVGKESGTLSLGGVRANNLKTAASSWSLCILRADVDIPQRPAHARDVGIFPDLLEAMSAVATDPSYAHHVLFTTSDALWLVLLPGQENRLEEILRPILDLGVVVNCTWRKSDFTNVRLPESEERAVSDRSHHFTVLPRLEEKIEAPLCEICQLREGKPREPEYGPGVVEVICDACYVQREKERFSKLGKWDEGPVLWCRVALEADGLIEHVQTLYKKYLEGLCYEDGSRGLQDDKGNPVDIGRCVADLQPAALLVDYTEDYKHFLAKFWCRTLSELESAGVNVNQEVEQITRLPDGTSDLFAVKLDIEGIPDGLLDVFVDCLTEWFPESAKRADCPVRVGLSVGHAKHPFFLHWDRLKELGRTVNLFSPARRPVNLSLSQFKAVRGLAESSEFGRSYLHDLAEIERRTGSSIMVEVKLIDDGKSRALEALRNERVSMADVLGYQSVASAGPPKEGVMG